MTPIFVANWKMNKLLAEATSFCEQLKTLLTPLPSGEKDVGIAPPITALPAVSDALLRVKGIMLGVQNVHWAEKGAHTGELSLAMVRELGAEFAILGHSERRQFYGETDAGVAKRAHATLTQNLKAIVCVGETKEQFEAKQTTAIVREQLVGSLEGITPQLAKNLIVAYEPVWAIGTGLAATSEIAGSVHAHIRQELLQLFGHETASTIPILYGGSTNSENIAELVAQTDVNGALIGGASLEAESFAALIKNGRTAKC